VPAPTEAFEYPVKEISRLPMGSDPIFPQKKIMNSHLETPIPQTARAFLAGLTGGEVGGICHPDIPHSSGVKNPGATAGHGTPPPGRKRRTHDLFQGEIRRARRNGCSYAAKESDQGFKIMSHR
jgi:hypothetical protein